MLRLHRMFRFVTPARAEWIVGGGVVLIAFGTYLATMYPGLGGGGDAAKFRFLGRVLGTAHPSGYPLYTLVSFLFARLPFGTLAYRINLMSVVFASLAVGAVYVTVRSLGGTRPAAAMAALGLAFGGIFWSKALLAEVYSLAGCLAAATLMALVKWRETGRTGWLFWAVAFASLEFGNHLTVMFAVPAFAVYALVSDARTCLRPRVLAWCAVIIALGAAQYGFIILRTHQHAPYLESEAWNLRDLWGVLTARRYADDIGAFNWHDLWTGRLPAAAALLWREFGAAGAAFAAVGLAVLARKRWREGVLIVVAALGVLAVTMYVAADSEGFLLPAIVFLWPAAGVGAHAVLSGAARLPVRRVAVPCALLLAAWVPAAHVAANYAGQDHSRRTFEDVYFGALFDVLPPRTIVVAEDYATDEHVYFELFGLGAARGRDIRLEQLEPPNIMAWAARGYDVFAFPIGRSTLEAYGLVFEPVQLPGSSVAQQLKYVRRGFIVAVAATPGVWGAMPASVRDAFGSAGVRVPEAVPADAALCAIGVRGTAAGSAVSALSPEARAAVAAGQEVGATGVASTVNLSVESSVRGAVVRVSGREVRRASSGLIVVVMAPGGTVVSADLVGPAPGFRIPIDMRNLPVYRMSFAGRCESVGNTGWKDVTPELVSGAVVARIDNYRAFDATFDLWFGAGDARDPKKSATAGSGTPVMTVEAYDTTDRRQRDALTGRLDRDGVTPAIWRPRGRYVYRVSVAVNDGGDYSTTSIDFGGRAANGVARARVDRSNPARGTLCSAPSSR